MTLANRRLPFHIGPANSSVDPNLSLGDKAAAEGHWLDAIHAWELAGRGADQASAQQRIRWFLETQDAIQKQANQTQSARVRAFRWIWLTIVAGAVGTGLVLFNLDRTGRLAVTLAISAWVCFGIAMIAACTYAWSIGRAAEPEPLTGDDFARAHELAAHLKSCSKPDGTYEGERRSHE